MSESLRDLHEEEICDRAEWIYISLLQLRRLQMQIKQLSDFQGKHISVLSKYRSSSELKRHFKRRAEVLTASYTNLRKTLLLNNQQDQSSTDHVDFNDVETQSVIIFFADEVATVKQIYQSPSEGFPDNEEWMLRSRDWETESMRLAKQLQADYELFADECKDVFNAIKSNKEKMGQIQETLMNSFKIVTTNLSIEESFSLYAQQIAVKIKEKILNIDQVTDKSARDIIFYFLPSAKETLLNAICRLSPINYFVAFFNFENDPTLGRRLPTFSGQHAWTMPHNEKSPKAAVHSAAGNVSEEILQSFIHRGVIDKKELSTLRAEEDQTLLHIAARYGSCRCVSFLLSQECDPLLANVRRELPIQLAAYGGDFQTFSTLLSKHQELDECRSLRGETGLNLLRTTAKAGAIPILRCLIERFSIKDCAERDSYGNTPLHILLKQSTSKRHQQHLPWIVGRLLKQNALLGERNDFGATPIDWMPEDSLQQLLDGQLSLRKELPSEDANRRRRDDFKVIFANLFENHRGGSGLRNIMAIAEAPHVRHLALHPVCQAILSVKWQKMRKFFVLKLLFYLAFVLFVTANCLLLLERRMRINTSVIFPNNANVEFWYNCTTFGVIVNLAFQMVIGLLKISLLLPVVMVQTRSHLKNVNKRKLRRLIDMYISEITWSNWNEYLVWIVTICHLLGRSNPMLLIFLCWFSLFLQVSKYPAISHYRYMLVRILIRYLRVSVFAFALLAAFSIAIFYEMSRCRLQLGVDGCRISTVFDNLISTMLKTSAMMSGNITPDDFPYSFSASFYVLIGGFIFVLTFGLFNMMNGLAITITSEFERRAKIFSTMAQCEMISEFEIVLACVQKLLGCCCPSSVKRAVSPLWVKMLRASPSTGECRNLEEFNFKIHGYHVPKEHLVPQGSISPEWIWVNRGYVLPTKVVGEALKICKKRGKGQFNEDQEDEDVSHIQEFNYNHPDCKGPVFFEFETNVAQ